MTVGVELRDADDGRVAHRRGNDVAQRIVIGALARPGARPGEATAGSVRPGAVRLPAVPLTQGDELGQVEPKGHVVGVEPQRRQASRTEVLDLVHLDDRPVRLVQEVARKLRESLRALVGASPSSASKMRCIVSKAEAAGGGRPSARAR